MSDVTIRKAGEPDVDEAFRLMSDLGYPDLDRGQFTRVFSTILEHAAMTVLIAEDPTGRVIGLASISHRPQLRLAGIVVSLDELVVSDEARGLGVGRALLDQAKATAHALGARRLELETNRSRESYRRGFYLKNGFVEANSAVMRLAGDSPEHQQ